jgi:hypothetical protein
MSVKHFKPEKRKHWPIIKAYQDKKISRAQAAAQLKYLGCIGWEIALYLDNDQSCDGDDA